MSNLDNTSIFFLAVMSQDLSLAVASHYIYHKSDTNAYADTHTHTHACQFRLMLTMRCGAERGSDGGEAEHADKWLIAALMQSAAQ